MAVPIGPTLMLALAAVLGIALFSMTIAFGVLWGQEKDKNADLMAGMTTTRQTGTPGSISTITTPMADTTEPTSISTLATVTTNPTTSTPPPTTPGSSSTITTPMADTTETTPISTLATVTTNHPTTSTPPTTTVETRPGVCHTEACIEAAYSLNRAMNKGVKPCDNFYEHACGNFNRTEPIPSDKTRWGVFDVLRRQLLRDLVGSLQVADANLLPNGTSANSTQKMQLYFHSCMNTEKIAEDSKDLSNLQRHFSEYEFDLKEWPASRPPLWADKVTLRKMIITARMYGNSLGVFPNGYSANISEPSQNIIEFDAGRFTLDRSTLLNDSKSREHEAYVSYMTDVALLIKKRISDDPTVNMTDFAEGYRETFQGILRFEQNLANLTLTMAFS